MSWTIALLFSILCSVTLAQIDNDGVCYNSAPRYQRMVVTTRDGGTPTNTLPDVLDPGHAKMLSIGAYTAQEVATLETEALAYFESQFGLNFTGAATYPAIPSAKFILIGGAIPALLIPYGTSAAAGNLYKVAFDSNNVDRGDGTWLVREFGMAVSLQGSGAIPGGARQGDLFLTGDVLAYTHFNWLKNGSNYSDPNCKCREVIKIQTYTPARTVTNTENLTDSIIKLTTVDEAGNNGDALVLITIKNAVPGVPGNPQQTIRTTLTWVCDTQDNVPCPATVPTPPVPVPVPVTVPPPCSGSGFIYASLIGFLVIILASIF